MSPTGTTFRLSSPTILPSISRSAHLCTSSQSISTGQRGTGRSCVATHSFVKERGKHETTIAQEQEIRARISAIPKELWHRCPPTSGEAMPCPPGACPAREVQPDDSGTYRTGKG